MKLSVLIPCCNEEKNIPRFATELWPVLVGTGFDFEVILVDDGSKDSTLAEAAKLPQPQVRVVKHDTNKGLGAAIRSGIDASSGDLLIPLDADLTFHPTLIPALLRALSEHPTVDFVIGSPALGGYGEEIPGWRLWISKAANLLYGTLLGKPITSINQILRVYKTSQLKALPLEAVGFDINAEILFKLVFSGKTFVEIPAVLTQRIYGTSKLNYGREIRRHVVLLGKIISWKLFGFSV